MHFDDNDSDSGEIYPAETIILHEGDTVYVDYEVTNIANLSQRANGTLTYQVAAINDSTYANENDDTVWTYDGTELNDNYIETNQNGKLDYINVGLQGHDLGPHDISFKIVGLRVRDTQGNITTYDIVM